MYLGSAIGLLDFQDATLSHPAYDLVSLLQDARYDVPDELASNMFNYYLSLHPEYEAEDFKQDYNILGFQRNCRILGVFARKAVRDNAQQYLALMPTVIRYLKSNKFSGLLKDYI
jgi:aminoglycoside/choline kinase family phosphotransferase